MAFECPSFMLPGVEAGADLSAKQYFGVKVNSSTKAVICSVAGEACVGVLQNKPTSGVAAQIMSLGITKATVGAAGVTANVACTVDNTGAFVDAAGADKVCGMSLATATSGQLTTVLLSRG